MWLRFVSHPGIFNWACQIAQYRFPWTHVEVHTSDGSLLGAMSDGVKIRASNYDAGEFVAEMYIEVKATMEQDRIFEQFLRRQVGKEYDFRAIWALFLTSRDWQDPNKWFCAELVAGAFIECGIFPKHLAVAVNRITVRDVLFLASALIKAGENAG
jgi:uncharacterized protein YycO